MLFEGLLNRGSIPVLERVMSFTEARQGVLANNVSNFDTVGYKVKDLSKEVFFATLREAVERRAKGGASAPLAMESTGQLEWDGRGRLRAQASPVANSNILFHDGNNRFVEKQMSEMAQNAMLHNVTAELLRGQYSGLQTAIRGRL